MIAAVWAWIKLAGGFLRSIPWEVWLFVALVALALWYGENRADSRETEVREEFAARDAAADHADKVAEAARDRKAESIATDASKAAAGATTETRVKTAAAAERVRYETRTIVVPADCVDAVRLPERVRYEGQQAVQRARAAASPMRAGSNP